MPITHLLKKDIRFEWTEACQRTFEELTDTSSTYPVLRTPDWDKFFHVYYDAIQNHDRFSDRPPGTVLRHTNRSSGHACS